VQEQNVIRHINLPIEFLPQQTGQTSNRAYLTKDKIQKQSGTKNHHANQGQPQAHLLKAYRR
jgi:hypothetical protein